MTQLLHWIDPNKLDYYGLSYTPSDGALELLEKNPEKIDWYYLSGNTNPKALDLLEQKPEKIYWFELSKNPFIFRLQSKGARKN